MCAPCFKKRKLDESKLIPGATVVGALGLVPFIGTEFMPPLDEGAPPADGPPRTSQPDASVRSPGAHP